MKQTTTSLEYGLHFKLSMKEEQNSTRFTVNKTGPHCCDPIVAEEETVLGVVFLLLIFGRSCFPKTMR